MVHSVRVLSRVALATWFIYNVMIWDAAYLSNIQSLNLTVSDGGNGTPVGMGGGVALTGHLQGAVGKLWLSETLLQVYISLTSAASVVTLSLTAG